MAHQIRVLHIAARMDRGGAETMIMNIYRNIDRDRIQFDFVVHTRDECAYDKEIESLGGRIFHVQAYIGKNHFQYKQWWVNFFKEHLEYKIIHSHIRSTASIYLKIAKKNGLTTIAHSHNTSSGSGFPAIVKSVLQFSIKYNADYLFACSNEAGKWLFGNKWAKSKRSKVIKNAIEVEKYKFDKTARYRIREQLKIEDDFVVGHVARFNSQKNHEFLIEIFYEIQKRLLNARLLLVGDGELREQIEKQIDILGITNKVILTGVVSNVNEYMQAMDIFVFPSKHEGLPLTLIEAQTAGLPCFISDIITNEVKVGSYIKKISLKDSPVIWADKVISNKGDINRASEYKKTVNADFDIKTNLAWIEQFYLNIQ